jgi:inner membrane transporter RhtA
LRRLRPRPAALGWALFLCSGVSSSVAAALATKTFDQVTPATGSGLSFVVAGFLAAALGRPRTGEWSSTRWRQVAMFGAVILVNVITLYLALERLPLGTTITLEFTGPLSLAVIHATHRRDYLAAAAAVAGVALVTGASADVDLLGVLLALAAASCWAAYTLLAKAVGAYPRPIDSLLAALVIGGLLALPLAAIACFEIDSAEVLLLLVAVAVLGRMLPCAVELVGLRWMTAGAAGVLFSIIPAIAAATGFLILGQPYSDLQALGMLIVVAASALVLRDAPS